MCWRFDNNIYNNNDNNADAVHHQHIALSLSASTASEQLSYSAGLREVDGMTPRPNRFWVAGCEAHRSRGSCDLWHLYRSAPCIPS